MLKLHFPPLCFHEKTDDTFLEFLLLQYKRTTNVLLRCLAKRYHYIHCNMFNFGPKKCKFVHAIIKFQFYYLWKKIQNKFLFLFCKFLSFFKTKIKHCVLHSSALIDGIAHLLCSFCLYSLASLFNDVHIVHM